MRSARFRAEMRVIPKKCRNFAFSMKRTFAILVLPFAFCAAMLAQDTLRIGYIDFERTLREMDGYAAAQRQLDELAQNYAAEYARMEAEYNGKVKEYVLGGKTLSEPIKLARQAEITECEDRMDLFKQRYTADLERQRTALFEPLRVSLKAAIGQEAEAQGITLVLDGQTPLYTAAPCVDMTVGVKKRLKNETK